MKLIALKQAFKRMNLSIIKWMTMCFIGFYAISILSLIVLGLPMTFDPMAIPDEIAMGFIVPIIVASLILFSTVLILGGILAGGMHRWLAMKALMITVGSFIATSIAMLLFCYWYSLPLLYPWQLYQIFKFAHYDADVNQFLVISIVISHMIIALPFLYEFIKQYDKNKKIFGDAHFATIPEIQNAKYFSDDGIVIGKAHDKWLRSTGDEHTLVFAPTGSGKTRSIAMPNLLTWSDSCVVNDVKGTLFKCTSKYREQTFHQQCFLWSLGCSEGRTHRYNPFSFLPRDNILRMTEIQRIAHIIIPDGKGDLIWYQSAREIFKAIVLYLMDTPGKILTFGEINRTAKVAHFDIWLKKILDETDHYHPDFYRNGYAYLNAHDRTRNGILKTFTGYFELFDDPLIDMATSESDFDIRQLRKNKMTIYVRFNEGDARRLSPLLTIFWEQLIANMIKDVPDIRTEPNRVLCLIDEFSSLRRIEELRQSLKLLREYRVRCVLMVQYIAQTFEKYSHDEAKAFTNIKTKITFTQDSIEDAEYISKLLGTKTKRITTGSTSHQVERGTQVSKNYSYQSVPLMRPEEIMRLKPSDAIIIRSGYAPVKAKQCIWYKERKLKNLPCGETSVPKYQPIQEPYIHTNKVVVSDDKELSDDLLTV